jgi:AcrR family transcriptional regulator
VSEHVHHLLIFEEQVCLLNILCTEKGVNGLSEHQRSGNVRAYSMARRADDVAQTRQRIIEAAVRLHGSIGPAQTTVSALAAEAGVTRLTVYRHFPEAELLFAECSRHWAAGQRMPDLDLWRRHAEPRERLRVGLSDLYRFYEEAQSMLAMVLRDQDVVPEAQRRQREETEAARCAVLLEPFHARGRRRHRLQGVLGHAVAFGTWSSFCVDNGLSRADAVEAVTQMVLGVAGRAGST